MKPNSLTARTVAALVTLTAFPAAQAVDTLPSWTYYETNSVKNTAHPGMGYITDGTWELRARHKTPDTLYIMDVGTGRNAIFNPTIPADTLDLRGSVTDADSGAALTITHFEGKPLGADSTRSPSTPTMLIMPTRLNCGLWGYLQGATVDTNGNKIAECYADYTNITMHIDTWFETITSNQRPLTSGDLAWDIQIPQLRHIHKSGLTATGSNKTLGTTTRGVLTEKSFPLLQELADHTFANANFSGVIYIPNAKYTEPWSGNVNNSDSTGITDITIGTAGNCCARLGKGSFGWNYVLTNAVVGLAATNTVADQIFAGCKSLRRVQFTGDPPNFTTTGNDFVTGVSEKLLTFETPGTEAWKAFLAAGEAAGTFTRMSDAEILADANDNPDKPIRIGVAAPALLHTTAAQYVAISRTVKLSDVVDFDAAFGDAVTCDYQPSGAGLLPQGIPITLTARPNAARGGAFAGWYGDVPDGKCLSETITLKFNAKPNGLRPRVFARFTHPWTLVERNGEKAIISNGVYRINVCVSGTDLTVSTGARALYAADNTVDGGVVDFGGPITDADGTAYRITGVYEATESLVPPKGAAYGARAFVSPGTCTGWTAQYCAQIFHASSGRWTYETIIIDEPTATGYAFTSWMYSDQRNLKYLIVRGENLHTGTSVDGALYNAQTRHTDFAWWNLPNCSFGKGQFEIAGNPYSYGTLSLANGVSIGEKVFIGNANLNGLRMGFGAKKSRVTKFGAESFKNCTGLTNLVLNLSEDFTVGADAFLNVSNLTTVTMLGPAPGEAAFAALFQGVVAAEAKPAVVHVSPRFRSWGRAAYVERATEAELADAPEGETVLGVYRGGAAAPAGKAWVCDRPTPFDPKGGYIIMR